MHICSIPGKMMSQAPLGFTAVTLTPSCNDNQNSHFPWCKISILLFTYLFDKLSDFSEFSMDRMNRLMNQVREYWYMGSMLARSAMEKNRMDEWTAMGR